jgi:hypothetical protein
VVLGVEERALVDRAVGVSGRALAGDDAVRPVALVVAAIGIGDLAPAARGAVDEAALVDRAVWIGGAALALDPALDPVALVDIAVGAGELALAMALATFEGALVAVARCIDGGIASFSIDNSAIRPGNQTATQSAIDASGAHAALRSFASGLAEHLERILEMMASYTLLPEMDFDVSISPDFSVKDDIEDIKVLKELWKDGGFPLEDLLDAMIERRMLPEDYDKEAAIEKLNQSMVDDVFNITPEPVAPENDQ